MNVSGLLDLPEDKWFLLVHRDTSERVQTQPCREGPALYIGPLLWTHGGQRYGGLTAAGEAEELIGTMSSRHLLQYLQSYTNTRCAIVRQPHNYN